MFASRHAVFIGPGTLNDELRAVLAKRAGALPPDVTTGEPRLLSVFESAADAERVASQVLRLKLGAAVAGPEQPPAELSWTVARRLVAGDAAWRVVSDADEAVALVPGEITAVTVLDWRPDEGAADRGVLLTLRDARPVMLRASLLDEVSRQSVPLEGMKRIGELLDALAQALPPDTRVRARSLSEAGFRAEALTGDLLPLVLAVVDAVDTLPGALPQPLTGRRPTREEPTAHYTGLAALCAWVLHLAALGGVVGSLIYFTVGAMALQLTAILAGLALGAWGSRRFMWARWLARQNWGRGAPIPTWPISADEPGIAPRWPELLLDVLAVLAVGAGALSSGVVRALSVATLPLLAVAVLCSAAAVYEAWQRE